MRTINKLALGANALLAGGIACIAWNHADVSRAAYEAERRAQAYCERSGMVPPALRCVISQAARNVSPVVLAAVAKQESGFRADVCSSAGACGLFQFMPTTAAAYAVDRSSAESSAHGADVYLGRLEKRFGNIGLALAAYNMGQTRLAAWLKKPGAKVSELPQETRDYVRAITGHGIEAFLGKKPPTVFGGHIGKLAAEMKKPGALSESESVNPGAH